MGNSLHNKIYLGRNRGFTSRRFQGVLAVAGIVGAGGNVGAVLAGFLMKGTGDLRQTLVILGVLVAASSLCALGARFGNAAVAAPAASAA